MSHISTYAHKAKDLSSLKEACEALGYSFEQGIMKVKQFGINSVDAIAKIKLPGWNYDVAVTEDGSIKYDHWGSQTDSFKHLGLTVQKYNEVAQMKAFGMEADNYWVEQVGNSRKLVFEFEV